MIYLVAQDPHWLFTYWDIDISRHPGGPCFLRVEDASGALEQEIEVPFRDAQLVYPGEKSGRILCCGNRFPAPWKVECDFAIEHRHDASGPVFRVLRI
jgi:hypothetical protein